MLPLTVAPAAARAPAHFGAISVAAAGVFVVLALLLSSKTRALRKLEFLKPWLYLLAGIGFAAAFAASWAATLAGMASSAVPYVGAAVPVVAAVILLYIVCYDLWPKHPSNRTTEIAALLLPSFGPQIGGTAGAFLSTALSSIAVAGAHVIATTLGI